MKKRLTSVLLCAVTLSISLPVVATTTYTNDTKTTQNQLDQALFDCVAKRSSSASTYSYQQCTNDILHLIQQGAHINAIVNGSTALARCAAWQDHDDLTSFLIRMGASPNVPLKIPALHQAKRPSTIQLLFEQGNADPNLKNNQGKTALISLFLFHTAKGMLSLLPSKFDIYKNIGGVSVFQPLGVQPFKHTPFVTVVNQLWHNHHLSFIENKQHHDKIAHYALDRFVKSVNAAAAYERTQRTLAIQMQKQPALKVFLQNNSIYSKEKNLWNAVVKAPIGQQLIKNKKRTLIKLQQSQLHH